MEIATMVYGSNIPQDPNMWFQPSILYTPTAAAESNLP